MTKPSRPSQEKHQESTKFAFALHEIGHAALLPPDIWTHSSLLPVSTCPACTSEGEEDESVGTSAESSGHTFYREPGIEGMQSVLYTIAGGAAEVACGIEPELMVFEGLGEYPIGMAGDFKVLSDDLAYSGGGNLQEHAVGLREFFDLAVSHIKPHAEKMREIAKLLVEKGFLRNGEVDFSFVEYAKLVEIVSGQDEPSPN